MFIQILDILNIDIILVPLPYDLELKESGFHCVWLKYI